MCGHRGQGLSGAPCDGRAACAGDKTLGKIMAAIAGDEARHEKAYIKIVDEFFKLSAPRSGLSDKLCCSTCATCLLPAAGPVIYWDAASSRAVLVDLLPSTHVVVSKLCVDQT